MKDLSSVEKKIDSLRADQAERLLRQVLNDAEITAGDELPVTHETRQALLEGLQEYNENSQEPFLSSGQQGELTKQSLKVLLLDPAFNDYLVEKPQREKQRSAIPRHFDVDVTSFLTTTTLALVVLSTYIDIKKDGKGQWTFHFRINSSNNALKVELIKLIKRLIPSLPE